MSRKIQLAKALKGPVRAIGLEHVMQCCVVWKFAENIEGAKKFLIDYVTSFRDAFVAGEFYDFPCFQKTVPDLGKLIANDPRATRPTSTRSSMTCWTGRPTWVPGLRHRGDRRDLQHVALEHDVREGRRRPGHAGGGARRGRGSLQAHLRQVEGEGADLGSSRQDRIGRVRIGASRRVLLA